MGIWRLCLHAFTKEDRLRKRSEFVELSKIGQKVQSRHFIAIVYPNGKDGCRLGVTVTRKVGKAATRNRIKRFSREHFRLNRHKVDGCWDINIIAKRSAAIISSQQAHTDLNHLLCKIPGNKRLKQF